MIQERQNMIVTTNFNNSTEDMARYGGRDDIRRFCISNRLNGLEYMRIPQCPEDKVPMELIQGIHLSSYQSWMDLWMGNKKALLEEYGSMEVIEQLYGGTTPQAMVENLRGELHQAQVLGAKYVVFHVSEVKIIESFTHRFQYTDREVITAAAELINQVLDAGNYSFDFLMENLWWPGMNLMNPEITEELLERVHYEKKGIMLDTGHLLHTNIGLHSQEEGVDYILQVLDRNRQIKSYIKGIHLNQSLTGDVACDMKQRLESGEIRLKTDYWERYAQVYSYIFQLDQHKPFTAAGVKGLIEKIAPKYLTFEFITRNRAEHERYLQAQWSALAPDRRGKIIC